jgi:hypothetical protein
MEPTLNARPPSGKTLTFFVLTTLMTMTSCRPQGEQVQSTPSAADSANVVEALVTWFECEECQAGELAAVTKYGQSAVPSLISVLRGGLSPAKRELVKRQLEERHDTLTAAARRNPHLKLASTKEQFVALYLGNFDAQYSARAAQALATIGGPEARNALEDALRTDRREPVRETIRTSLQRMK